MPDWNTWTPIAISSLALFVSAKSYGLSKRVHHDNREHQRRREDLEFYPRVKVDLGVGPGNTLFVTITNESAKLQCVAGILTVELSVANGVTHTQKEERLPINRVDADSKQEIVLTGMNERINNCIPLIRQETGGDFPGAIGGHFWIRVLFEFEGAIADSERKCAFGRFCLDLKQDDSIGITRRD
jgi:hypothetical protein